MVNFTNTLVAATVLLATQAIAAPLNADNLEQRSEAEANELSAREPFRGRFGGVRPLGIRRMGGGFIQRPGYGGGRRRFGRDLDESEDLAERDLDDVEELEERQYGRVPRGRVGAFNRVRSAFRRIRQGYAAPLGRPGDRIRRPPRMRRDIEDLEAVDARELGDLEEVEEREPDMEIEDVEERSFDELD